MASDPPAIDFQLNGRPVRAACPLPHHTLLDELRDRGLTGAKEGCAEGECGACTVVCVVRDGSRSAMRAINSCLVPLPIVAGQEIHTVESLAHDGRLSAPQQAMAAAGGSQCGYCTPGFVMSLFAEYYRPTRIGPCNVDALAGNLCRCTGYRPIRDAVAALGPRPIDAITARLERPTSVVSPLAIDGFSRPANIEACIAELAARPDAVVVAGATDLAVEANLKGRRWPHLVSLDVIDELHRVSVHEEGVHIGAAVPLAALTSLWPTRPAVVDTWLSLFASPLIRNRATIGGNLGTASPIGDAAPLLLALDARVHLAGPNGRRTIGLDAFFTGYRKTVLAAGELIVSIEVASPLPHVVRFYKVAKRRVDDISTVAAAFALDRDDRDRVTRARFAFGGVAATPVRLREVENDVVGQRWTATLAAHVARRVEAAITPMSDHRGSALYRRQVSGRLVEKFSWEITA